MEQNFEISLEDLRNDIRIKQGREKPIDFFIKLLKILKNIYPIPSNFLTIDAYKHPYQILTMLPEEEKNETLRNIKYHFDINSAIKDNKNISKKYWISIYYLSHFICESSKKELLNNEELLSLFNYYKTEQELIIAEKEIKENIKNKTEDIEFWKDSYCLAKYLKYKKYLEDLYDNFIKSHKKEIEEIKKNENNKLEQNLSYNGTVQNVDNINGKNLPDPNLKKKGRRKGSLSPPGYESDEELRKVAMTEHDFLFELAEKRKIILIEKLKEYKENKISEEINKNKNIQNRAENSDSKKGTVENILGENFQDAINFLNKIAEKSRREKDKLKKLKKKEREKEKLESNSINLKTELMSDITPKINNNIEIFKNNCFRYEENEIPDINMNTMTSINLIEEQGVDVDELGANEKAFNECVEVDANYDWSSKYKPIKPRYSNKVKMGFDWNRHNQAHYTSENLPPKTIQGYRFNIFYPYLVDKTKTPQYKIERCNTPDTCILRFHSGAPYEDIAFKIKNREWDMSEKSGFKNIFEKGILRLYFKFKRFKYKR